MRTDEYCHKCGSPTAENPCGRCMDLEQEPADPILVRPYVGSAMTRTDRPALEVTRQEGLIGGNIDPDGADEARQTAAPSQHRAAKRQLPDGDKQHIPDGNEHPALVRRPRFILGVALATAVAASVTALVVAGPDARSIAPTRGTNSPLPGVAQPFSVVATGLTGITATGLAASASRSPDVNASSPAAATTSGSPSHGLPAPVSCPGCWHPALQTSWNWVINQVPSAPYRDVQMYNIDGFDAAASDVAALHKAGKKVVCYISVGSYENWRSDAAQFPAAILGKSSGWPGERWLDIRNARQPGSTLVKIMNTRLDMCDGKGFDAVEFGNMDGYTNNTGFPLTASDQAYYNTFLANGARSRGMSTMMENDVNQISQLLPYFDMALSEQCNEYHECGGYARFVAAGKPVFNAEYQSSTSFCAADNAANFNGVRFSTDLDDSTYQACR
jgi:hypothetical protein